MQDDSKSHSGDAQPPHFPHSSEHVPIRSEDLLGARGELLIEHRGRAYRLRITQNGKLILTA
jgi:hemin uptake protein HemP